MFDKPLKEITAEDISRLIDNEEPEGRILDYKATLSSTFKDEDKKEFLFDVTSFANASGGYLIYGITEKRKDRDEKLHIPEKAVGVELTNYEEWKLKIENILNSCIEPRIHGIAFHKVDDYDKGPVVVIYIPQSPLSPHLVKFKWKSRFYSRNSAGKYPLDYVEIKTAFGLSGDIANKIRDFRDSRIALLISDNTPVVLAPTGRAIMHLIPLSALNEAVSIDVKDFYHREIFRKLFPLGRIGYTSQRFNFDGFLSFETSIATTEYEAYAQFLNNGIIESASNVLLGSKDNKRIGSIAYEEYLIESVEGYLGLYNSANIRPPFFMLLALVDVKGYQMTVDHKYRNHMAHQIDRDTLILSDIRIDDYAVNVSRLLKPAFDAIWRACGWSGSLNYDNEGNWRRHS